MLRKVEENGRKIEKNVHKDIVSKESARLYYVSLTARRTKRQWHERKREEERE